MQLNLPTPPLVRITFSGRTAISTGVVNLAVLFGSTDFLLVKVLPPESTNLAKGGDTDDETDENDCPGNSDNKTNPNGAQYVQLCDHAGLPLGCFSVEAGGSYEVVRRGDIPLLEDSEKTQSVDEVIKKDKLKDTMVASGEHNTVQKSNNRKEANKVMRDDEGILATRASLRGKKGSNINVTQKNSGWRKRNRNTDALGEHSEITNGNEGGKGSEPGVNLTEHLTLGDKGQDNGLNNEEHILTAPMQLEAPVDSHVTKKSHKKQPREKKRITSDELQKKDGIVQQSIPGNPKACRDAHDGEIEASGSPMASPHEPENTAEPPPPPLPSSSSTAVVANRKRHPPFCYSNSRSNSSDGSVSREPSEVAHTSKRMRHIPRDSSLPTPSSLAEEEKTRKRRKESEVNGIKNRKEHKSSVPLSRPSPLVVPPSVSGQEMRPLALGEYRDGSSAPYSNSHATPVEYGRHAVMPHDSPALGFTVVDNTLSQEFSLGSSSASSFAEYVY